MKVESRVDTSKKKLITIEKKVKQYKPAPESIQNITVEDKDSKNLGKDYIKVHFKPKKFSKIITQIHILFDNIVIFDAMITGILIFLFSYVILIVLGLNTMISFFIPPLYIFIYLFIKLRENKYIKIEKKFPHLDEKITTAVDNINVENPVVEELRNEISRDINEVDYASFYKERKTSFKVLIAVLLCFSIILLAQYDVEFKLDPIKNRVLGFVRGGEGNATGIISDIISAATYGQDDDIFGEEYLSELGDDELTINMNKVGYEINIDDVKDPSQTEFQDSLFPEDIGFGKDKVYVQKDFKEHNELVKNYFKNMAES